ncbi:intracellular protease, PfpI family [Gloeothece citriformis PCC 7424]|uniref:Intracellular protease, PfpI family n=1 Tax=Gloeothece citriformis (strain PCC 7424) TaxID=65393 RepID=B7KCJ9_GLOC7|nr:DJ-1/PfpI/YhbO family deglycase/protease [Gloeothece citriformis]ACK71550.1 intracellular protease, PfpI family [Gloeothece citriformis PCC 7424]
MVYSNGNKQARIGILLENHFEDFEFKIPYTALKQAGSEVVVIGSRMNDEYQGKRGKESVKPDATATEIRAEDFDCIIIPGGNAPDRIRANPNAIRLIIDAMAQEKLIATVCHGIQVLIEADQIRDKQVTGFRSIRKDIENAGATYIDEPVVVQGNLITARQPGDLPIFTTVILTRLNLSLENTNLPDVSDLIYEWWQLGEIWGGSTRGDLVNALNTALTGENYTAKAFELYAEKATDFGLKTVLEEILVTKRQHIDLLKNRLSKLGENITWQTLGSEAFATWQSWMVSSDNLEILRRALGDIQTGVVDSYHLCNQLSDPFTVALLTDIESNLSRHEIRLSELYRARLGSNVKPPMPTTMAVVG